MTKKDDDEKILSLTLKVTEMENKGEKLLFERLTIFILAIATIGTILSENNTWLIIIAIVLIILFIIILSSHEGIWRKIDYNHKKAKKFYQSEKEKENTLQRISIKNRIIKQKEYILFILASTLGYFISRFFTIMYDKQINPEYEIHFVVIIIFIIFIITLYLFNSKISKIDG